MRWQRYEVRWWLPDSRHDLRWTFQIFVTLRPCQDSQTCHKRNVRVDINSYFLQQNVLQFTKTLIYLPMAPAIDPQVNEHWILLPGFVENRRHQPKGVYSSCLCKLKLTNSWVSDPVGHPSFERSCFVLEMKSTLSGPHLLLQSVELRCQDV